MLNMGILAGWSADKSPRFWVEMSLLPGLSVDTPSLFCYLYLSLNNSYGIKKTFLKNQLNKMLKLFFYLKLSSVHFSFIKRLNGDRRSIWVRKGEKK